MIFGNVQAGDYDGIRDYTFKRINAAVNAYEPVDGHDRRLRRRRNLLRWPVVTTTTTICGAFPRALLSSPMWINS
jgi:hypothetical protein